MALPEDVGEAFDTFIDNDTPLIDLTEPKTFTIAVCVAILLGVMIGFGYNVVFTSIDCTNPLSGKVICFPNEYADHKLEIVIVTLIAGVLAGASPYLIRKYVLATRENDEIPFEEHHE